MATRRLDATLAGSEEPLRILMDGIRDCAIVMLDPHGRISSWGAGAAHITGYGAEEVVGRHIACLFAKKDVGARLPWKQLRTARRAGRFEGEGWRIRRDGSRFLAHAVLTAVRDGAGALRGFVGVTHDVTERTRGEEALRQERDRLEARVRECTEALDRANLQLELERTAHEQKNATLGEVLDRIHEEKEKISSQVMRNVQAIIMPMLRAVEAELPPAKRSYTALLAAALAEISSPFAQELANEFTRLTPSELRICDMIRRGLTAKEIAQIERTAPATVNKHREHIRRKLGLKHRSVNLATYLQARMRTATASPLP